SRVVTSSVMRAIFRWQRGAGDSSSSAPPLAPHYSPVTAKRTPGSAHWQVAGQLDNGPQRGGFLLRRGLQILMCAFILGSEVRTAGIIHRDYAAGGKRKRSRTDRKQHCRRVPHRPVVRHFLVIAISLGERMILNIAVVVENADGRIKYSLADLKSAGHNR